MLRLLLGLFILLLPAFAPAQESATTKHAKVTLMSDVSAVQPGEPFWLAVQFDMVEDWHIYWRNPGDSGLPPRFEWTMPEGFRTKSTHWPAPERIEIGGLTNYGYHEDATLLIPVVPPKELADKTSFEIGLKADWLICKEVCIPESATLSLTLGVNNEEEPALSAQAEEIRAERKLLPRVLRDRGSWYEVEGKITFELPLSADRKKLQDIYFFPGLEGAIEHAEPQTWKLESDEGPITVTVKRGTAPLDGKTNGVVALYQSDGNILYYFARLKPDATAAAAAAKEAAEQTPPSPQETGPAEASAATEPTEATAGWQAILFALLGGVLLNAMPCVFPVLSLKALAISKKAQAESAAVRKQGLAYLAGTVSSFMLLGAVLVTLKAGGESIGWGFQLQSPAFVAGMIYLFLLLGLSLAGMYELPQMLGGLGNDKASKDSASGSFFTGILAVLVATPCTVPFMAPALSYAFSQSEAITLSIMAAMGLGLALPYLLVSFYPAVQQRLPKPGPWMQSFKEFMAYPILATAAWLLWVLAQQADVMGLAAVLAAMVLLPFCLWLGRRASKGLRWVAIVLAVGGILYSFSVLEPASAEPERVEFAYSAEQLKAFREAGTPVFLDATAAWCITCKVNERVALRADAVLDAFREQEIIFMVADWTNHDAAITALLREYHHEGVPLYVYFPPQGQPVVLPQLLTESIVLNAIKGEE